MNPNRKKRSSYFAPVALLTGALIVTGSSLAFSRSNDADAPEARQVNFVVDESPIQRDGKFTTSFAPVVKQVAPSVVQVATTARLARMDSGGAQQPFMDNPFFRRFFGDQFDREELERNFRRQMPAPQRNGIGSGVIVSEDGYILTNNHVVENADTVTVTLTPTGEEYQAKVIGSDPKTDIALLKVDGEKLPALKLGDSDHIEVGDLVLAVGNPFGIGQTVTMGMVSATSRGNVGIGEYEDFIQTDAAINPGNSGGALVDAEGRLVGINTAILSRSGGNQGIGFAVPINMARSVMENLVEHGRVIRGFLGVHIQDLTSELAQAFDLDQSRGALVSAVTPDSPAMRSGIEAGDVIVQFDGEPIRDSRHLKLAVGETNPDKKVKVTVLRDGKEKVFTVRLKELEGKTLASRGDEKGADDTSSLEGVAVRDIDREARQQLDLPKDLKGALVADVAPDSAAFKAGLRSGDVILEINRKAVANADEAVERSEKIERGLVVLRVWSNGGTRYLAVDERAKS